jgi:hypothetical protein
MYIKPPAPSGLGLVVAETHRFPNLDHVSGVICVVTRDDDTTLIDRIEEAAFAR